MGFHTSRGNEYRAYRSSILLSLHQFREVTSAGAVGAVAAAGGVLASDTTPIMGAEATTEANVLTWAAANADIIQTTISLPEDFDGREDVLVDLQVRTDNTGGGSIEAATFSVLTSWDNGTQVTDTCTDTTPAETVHVNTATIDKADVPDSPFSLNIQLVPGTHANDPTRLLGVRIRYVRKTV